MFGLGLASAYGGYVVDLFGGTNAAFLYAVVVRLLVGIGWFLQFRKVGKNPLFAFVPFLGEYTAFRLVWDDFSFAFIFGATTIIAFIDGILVEQSNSVIMACSVINFVIWWLFALLSARAYGVNMLVGLLYGSIPWLGGLLMALWPSASYRGAWSSDPNDERNLTTQERKKRRKKAAREAKRVQQEQRRNRKANTKA